MRQLTLLAIILLFCASGLSGQAHFPVVTKFVEPPYPPAAVAVRASGDVNVLIEVSSDGTVIHALATSGHPLLRPAAVAASRNWSFSKVPGTHYLNVIFRFRDTYREKWKPAELNGHYALEVIMPRFRILQTVSNSTTTGQ